MVGSFKQIAIGSDHAGFIVKEYIREKLGQSGYDCHDFGTFSETPMDYPDMAHLLAKAVQSEQYQFGILICSSGNGVAIVANKYTGIRAAICWNEEITKLARSHNDANIIVLPASFVDKGDAFQFVLLFMASEFEGGRHKRRIDKIDKIL